jgi:hypothetical protein
VFGSPWKLGDLAINIVGLNGVIANRLRINAPLWTLAYEIWFYVIAGALGSVTVLPSGTEVHSAWMTKHLQTSN